MLRHYLFGILMLLATSCREGSSRPSNNESMDSVKILSATPNERSLTYDETNTENEDTTKDILEKIKAINDALKKPHRQHQLQWNAPQQIGGGYILDKEILEKLQQVIASGKLNANSNNKQQEDNTIANEDLDARYSRQLAPLFAGNSAQMAVLPPPYIMNMPVVVMPSMNNMYNYVNPMELAPKIQTKEGQTSPFSPFQWALAPLFPILIRDPLLSIMNGGGWNNFIEYGQSADICRKQKSNEQNFDDITDNQDENVKAGNVLLFPNSETKSRQKRTVKKRTVNQESQLQNIDPNQLKKFFAIKPTTTTKPTKHEPEKQNTKTTGVGDGDVRFHMLDLFGNKYRQPTGPGFFINRLKVRRGGVAIAGPGGVATAGRGGTAIVGPGGLAYTQPGGLAVAGPAARVIALTSEADLTSIANRLQEQSTIDSSIPQLLQSIPEGRIVATGPVVYYHPNQPFYRGHGWRQDRQWSGFRKGDQYRYDGMNFEEGPLKLKDSKFMLFVKPVAHALSAKGPALAIPMSQVVVARNQSGTIFHAPLTVAVAGPGGIAHAQSELYLYEYVTE